MNAPPQDGDGPKVGKANFESAEQEQYPHPPTNQANRPAWQRSALWFLVLFNFGALIFVVHVIWTKCDGNLP